MKKEKKLDVVFILDKSGSMSGSEESTISSFNEYLQKEMKKTIDVKITTVLFSDQYRYLYRRKDVSKVSKLTSEDYFVGGCTALYDSIGSAIQYMDRCDTDKVIFIIITDGYENASRKYNRDQVRRMIQKHSQYEFIYIGADIDSYAAGGDIGIDRSHIANYKKDERGTSLLFKSLDKVEACVMDGERLMDHNWKEDLEDYLEKHQSN